MIIVLNCESSSMRFRDTESLRKWCIDVESPKANKGFEKERKLISLTQKVNLVKL